MALRKRSSHSRIKGGPAPRHRAFVVLVVAGLMLVPAAIAWACGPNRAIQLDKVTYSSGGEVNVTGANFDNGATVNILVDGRTVATTVVSGTGNIATAFKAPTSPGTYAVGTDGVDERGQSLAGTGNTVTLTVEQAPAPSAGGGPGSTTPGAGSPGASAPGAGSPSPAAPRTPAANAPQTGSAPPRSTSGGQPAGRGENNRSASGGQGFGRTPSNGGAPANANAPADAGINTTEGTITTDNGGTAFAGSVTQATRTAVAERVAKGSAPQSPASTSASPSESSAGADLWSGLSSGDNPSLVPADGAGPLASGETGSGLQWGMLLLAGGLLALVGLGVAEATRRRRATAG